MLRLLEAEIAGFQGRPPIMLLTLAALNGRPPALR
jgi:hypothetical protein